MDTIGSKVTFSYLSNSNASGAFRLTNQEIFSDSAGSQEGVVVKTSVGDVTASCAAATTGEKWIEVNLSTQTMTVWRGSSKVSSSLVSTGKPGFETPTGTFYISTKYTSVTMTGCAGGECWSVPAVPWAMLFRSGGYFIHGAYWHNQFGISRLSHGCVNLPGTVRRMAVRLGAFGHPRLDSLLAFTPSRATKRDAPVRERPVSSFSPFLGDDDRPEARAFPTARFQ